MTAEFRHAYEIGRCRLHIGIVLVCREHGRTTPSREFSTSCLRKLQVDGARRPV